MPVRVTHAQTNANANNTGTAAVQSRPSVDDGDSGAESRSAKKRVAPSTNSMNTQATEKRSAVPSLTSKPTPNRARTSSNVKGPAGPRLLEELQAKRSISGPTSQSSGPKPSLSTPTQDLHPRQSINNISRFSFASIAPVGPYPQEDDEKHLLDFGDLLTPATFDEYNQSTLDEEARLSQFALPGTQPSVKEETKTVLQPTLSGFGNGSRQVSAAGSVGRKASLQRQQSNASTRSELMQSASAPSLRNRRQSHFPPNSFHNTNTTVKAPRKSIGPGTFEAPDPAENSIAPRRPVGGRKFSGEKSQKESALALRLNNRGISSGALEGAKLAVSARNMKAKSLQPARQDPRNQVVTPTKTPDQPRSSSSNAIRTPGKSAATRTTTPSTPSTSNKRMSVLPHATGLGARTISPTDARRMKRISMMPQPPPIPQSHIPKAPPTPQPEPPQPRPPSTAQSPAINRKSVTPSSSRTTPDPNRKSYGSGQSSSSNTSNSSVRNSTTGQPRLSRSGSSSRQSTPKPRLDNGSGGNDEDVPPVPAIPKAFESPQSEFEQAFFSARSSNLPPVDTPITVSPEVVSFADAIKALESQQNLGSPASQKHSLVIETEPSPRKPAPNIGKKNLQPLRLPPMNLLPLNTPTTTKIKALGDAPFDTDECTQNSPPRGNAKTPSTPMTASKASFFSRGHRDMDIAPFEVTRSRSMHFALPPDFTPFGQSDNTSPTLPFGFEAGNEGSRNISPFVSSSLPKTGGDFAHYLRPKFSAELSRITSQPKPNGPRAPSFSITPKVEDKIDSPEVESGFSASASALKRKLSLSRKRSSSRTMATAGADTDAAKYDNMPPPKLPASATWSNLVGSSSSPTQKQSYLKSRRKTSSSSTHFQPPVNRHESFSSDQNSKTEGLPSPDSSRSFSLHANRSTPHMSPTPAVLSHKAASTSELRLPAYELDRDDMMAEEEMKKLASKRKDFESAARELDMLRRRACAKERASPSHTLATTTLNIFERGEIVDYKDIYFTGTRTARKIAGDLSASAMNFGYDDDRGDYNIVDGDHLAYRYEVIDLLGKGSFGQVVRCIDHKTGILVAVKIIRNKKRFHQQALVEVNILQKLREWDPENKHSVVNFDQSFYFRGHLCISTDLLDMNLYEFIKAHDFKGFSIKLIRRFTKQLLSSLVLLHNHNVIHCDLKPENVLLAHPIHSEIKVIDFGSSCFENEKVYTYIQSRFYRSPEVILGISYGMPIDMWSLGCILAELYTGYPIFPGENEQEQLACIMEVFGPPEKHLIEKSSRRKLFFDSMGKPRPTVSSKGKRRRPSSKDLRQVLKCDDEAFLDFISRCLRWDPARRLTPHEANLHEFITGVKVNTGRRGQTTASASSPVKRVNSVSTPGGGGARPLPQPPTTSFRNGVAVKQPDVVTASPSKPATKRQSTMNGLQSALIAKRASHAAIISSASTSALPRIAAQRSFSSKSDFAAAAAAASLTR